MRDVQVEDSLLNLFRLWVIVWLLIVYGVVGFGLLVPNTVEPGKYQVVFSTLAAPFMLGFLYSRLLKAVLGYQYLPIALWFFSILAAISTIPEVIWEDNYTTLFNGADLIVALSVPLVIIGVQYSFKAVLGILFGIATSQIILALIVTLLLGKLNLTNLYASIESIPVATMIMNSAITLLAVYIPVGLLVAILTSGQKAARVALLEKNHALAQYAATVERLSVSQERNRLARELHDTIAHTLSGLSVQLEALNKQLDRDPEVAKTIVKDSRDMVRGGLQDMRRALQALRASPLDDLGFELAIHNLVASMRERSGINIALTMPEYINGIMSFEVEQVVYRITEEALNNIVRHANADTVSITLQKDKNKIILNVTDNGLGFDVQEASTKGRFGLIGMHERALLCDGNLEIISKPGDGTSIRLTVAGRED
ncbi:MAG: sensor histidine kinase [Aggregatilineales bacterium]